MGDAPSESECLVTATGRREFPLPLICVHLCPSVVSLLPCSGRECGTAEDETEDDDEDEPRPRVLRAASLCHFGLGSLGAESSHFRSPAAYWTPSSMNCNSVALS